MYTKSQKNHYRRGLKRLILRNKKKLKRALYIAIEYHDDIHTVMNILNQDRSLVYAYEILYDVKSEQMWKLLIDYGAPCNFWTYEGGNTVCCNCIKKYTSIRV
jgi:hypothetical protein